MGGISVEIDHWMAIDQDEFHGLNAVFNRLQLSIRLDELRKISGGCEIALNGSAQEAF